VCFRALPGVSVCCSVLQCVAAWGSVLQCNASYAVYDVLHRIYTIFCTNTLACAAVFFVLSGIRVDYQDLFMNLYSVFIFF